MTTNEVLKQCTVEENVVRLPDFQLDRKVYLEVKEALEFIGGKWKGRPVNGFIFKDGNAEMLLSELIDSGKEGRELKKETQFFYTPKKVVELMVKNAEINSKDLTILEPSAGKGHIIYYLPKLNPTYACEKNKMFANILRKEFPEVKLRNMDFLEAGDSIEFDRIIANPPFRNNQDIDHIYKMYEICKKGGRIVTMSSKHWTFANGKKETKFREWIKEVNAIQITIEGGSFSESGTQIETIMLIINK